MEYEIIPIDGLREDPANARRHDIRNIEAIKGSLARFGQRKPIVVGPEGIVLAGNGTLRAARELGWTEIAIVRTDLKGAEAIAYSIADNRSSDLSAFDDAEISALLSALEKEDATLRLAAGYDDDELRDLLLRANGPGNGLTDPDDVPDPPDEPTTKKGELIILGDHRLMCGDSSSPEDLDRLLGGETIHLLNTDPPYNVKVEPRSNNAIASGGRGMPDMKKVFPELMTEGTKRKLMSHQRLNADHPLGARGLKHHQKFNMSRDKVKAVKTTKQMRAKDRTLVNDFMTDDDFEKILLLWFMNASRVMAPGASAYIWGGYANVANYPPALKAAEIYFSQAIIWVKNQPVLTRKDFMGTHEWCFYGWKLGAGHFFNPEIHNARDVWAVDKVSGQKMVHLTEKPVELAERAMTYSSKPGQNVLDLFGGSGSTLIAAERLGRRAFLMEIDEAYADVIVTRFEAFTGKKATREPAP